MSKFQIVLLVFFGVFIVIAVLLFSMSRGGGSESVSVTLWGPISSSEFSNILTKSGLAQSKTLNISYVEKTPEEFDTEFTEALATGSGPDLVILPHDKLWKNKNKLLLIPDANLGRAEFSSTFVEEGELFFAENGTYALPLYVDPLVLYYNRDLLSKAGIAKPPVHWDQLYEYSDKLTEQDAAGNIVKSAISLGEARNIPNAKEILSVLMLGAGAPITSYFGNELRASLTDSNGQTFIPGEAALDFYTQFSNPLKPFYSWNRSLLPANTMFVSGDLAMYIGFGSEFAGLKEKNPNLNIALAPLPQSQVSGSALTFGRLYGVAITRSADDPAGAYNAALALTAEATAAALSEEIGLPPVRRDLLSKKISDPIQAVLYTAAVQSRGWVDPNDTGTKKVFVDMIEAVTSGRARTGQALSNARGEIDALIEN